MDKPIKPDRRNFTPSERSALFEATDGRCPRCGGPLGDDFEIDHVEPRSRGGRTDVLNGQAVCRPCNRKKGSRGLPDLRTWQQEALDKLRAERRDEFLCVATPGAGKTTFANAVAFEMLRTRRAQRVVVICPSDHLKKQWTDAASSVGIELDCNWTIGRLASDFQGVVVTYQAVASNAHAIRLLTSVPTVAVLDEIHHAGETKSWGDNLQYALQSTVFRLALSGTPFRSDNNAIPFVRYDGGLSVADFSYGYGQALEDDVVRPVFFPRWDGQMEWMHGLDVVTATFADDLDDQASRERLRTAIISEEWLREVITAANRQLHEIRGDAHADAGGLVIAMDQPHAKRIAQLIKKVTGQEPTLAISEDTDASAKISSFARNRCEWLVAVKMVSEGVDIPRLRVCVFATNVSSWLFFRQAVGRLVRVIPTLDDQNAYFYIPDDPTLVRHALQIKQERAHYLSTAMDRVIEEARRELAGQPAETVAQLPLYAPISAEANEVGAVFNEELIEIDELGYAREVVARAGLQIRTNESLYEIVALLRAAGKVAPQGAVAIVPSPTSQPVHLALSQQGTSAPLAHRKKELRKLNSKAIGQLAVLIGAEHKTLNWEMNKAVGVKKIEDATGEQLVRRLDLIRRRIEEASS